MKLLDLFCGAGGASMGYCQAGFDEIVGVDIIQQPRYPFKFIQANALEYPLDRFDVIHASPPCQGYSATRTMASTQGKNYPMLTEQIRDKLINSGLLYVIENVPGCPMINPIMLCGVMFGIKVFRHRLFESNAALVAPAHIPHGDRRIGKDGFCSVVGHGDSGRNRIPKDHRTVDCMRRAMEIDWMVRREITQAIPPAYTEFIGQRLLNNK
jgi:DNA (cytosine-5)-methyltransferase 1